MEYPGRGLPRVYLPLGIKGKDVYSREQRAKVKHA